MGCIKRFLYESHEADDLKEHFPGQDRTMIEDDCEGRSEHEERAARHGRCQNRRMVWLPWCLALLQRGQVLKVRDTELERQCQEALVEMLFDTGQNSKAFCFEGGFMEPEPL